MRYLTILVLALVFHSASAQQGLGIDRQSFMIQMDYHTGQIFTFEDSPLLDGTPRLLGMADSMILELTGPEHDLSKVTLMLQLAAYSEDLTTAALALVMIAAPSWPDGPTFVSKGLGKFADGTANKVTANHDGLSFKLEFYKSMRTIGLVVSRG